MALTHQQAEHAMAKAMRNMGFGDARAMPGGPDGGIDVRSRSAVAQVKHHRTKIGRPDLQRLHGARGMRNDQLLLFFARTGYTKAAVDYASSVGMALFTLDDFGGVNATNGHARALAAKNPSWSPGNARDATIFRLILTCLGLLLAVPLTGIALGFNLFGWIALVVAAILVAAKVATE